MLSGHHASRRDRIEDAATPAPGELVSFTRRAGLRKAAYIAPAVIALQVAVPNVTLGRSGPTGQPVNPGSNGQTIATDKSPSQAKGPKKK